MSGSGHALDSLVDSVTALATVVPGGNKNELEVSVSTILVDTSTVTVMSFVSVDDDSRVSIINGSSSTFGKYVIKINGTFYRSLNSSPKSSNNVLFTFPEPKRLPLGTVLLVEFTPCRILDSITNHYCDMYLGGFIQV